MLTLHAIIPFQLFQQKEKFVKKKLKERIICATHLLGEIIPVQHCSVADLCQSSSSKLAQNSVQIFKKKKILSHTKCSRHIQNFIELLMMVLVMVNWALQCYKNFQSLWTRETKLNTHKGTQKTALNLCLPENGLKKLKFLFIHNKNV